MCENKNYQCLRVDCKLNLTVFFKLLTAHDLFTIKVKTKNKETNTCSPLDYILSLQHSSWFFFTVFVWFVFDLSLMHTCTCKILILIAQAQVYVFLLPERVLKSLLVYIYMYFYLHMYIYIMMVQSFLCWWMYFPSSSPKCIIKLCSPVQMAFHQILKDSIKGNKKSLPVFTWKMYDFSSSHNLT